MGFKMVIVPPNTQPDWPEKIRAAVPDCEVLMFDNSEAAMAANIGRGGCVVLDDLVDAIRAGEIAGAGLDVFQMEPLPAEHPLWTLPGVLITPHVARIGPYLQDRRTELLIDNCMRFNEGRELRNIVDKTNWF